MKINYVSNFLEAVNSFEIFNGDTSGISPDNGEELQLNAIKASEIESEFIGKITGTLIFECYYAFRRNLDGTKFIPKRVSMHPKTAANYAKGSARYGSGSIL